jgi:hypothetical protein
MVFAGGIPLTRDGKIVGAVGVSGGSGEQDHSVVRPAQRRSNLLQLSNIQAINRGVVYAGPGKVEVQSIDFPVSVGSRSEHGGSEAGSTNTAATSMGYEVAPRPIGMVLGHDHARSSRRPDVEFKRG